MVTPAASRFAVLPIDDDGDTSRRIKIKKKDDQSKSQNQTQTNQNATGPKKPEPKKKQNGKKKPDNQGAAAVTKKVKPKGESNKKKAAQDQWEQWKQRDAQFVDSNYEDELQQAMLLSKLDYEENKDYYDQIKKSAEEEKKAASKKTKKSNKAQPMSLSQFNQLGETDSQNEDPKLSGAGDHIVNGNEEPDPEFFDRIKTEAKKALQSEKAEEERKLREPMIDELISVAQYQDRLQKCNEEIERLKSENEKFKQELKTVKSRNKKLCELLLQGEMKEKAMVLVEVDKLQRVNDELSNEVSNLVAQLEEEKSKVRALTEAKDKPGHKKNVRFNASSETTRSK